MNHLVTAGENQFLLLIVPLHSSGLMTCREKEEFDKIDSPHIKYWQPMHWVFSLLKEAKAHGRISDIVFIDMLEVRFIVTERLSIQFFFRKCVNFE